MFQSTDKINKHFWFCSFAMAKDCFVELLQDILDKAKLECNIKEGFIGKISLAQIGTEDEIYVAVDCIVPKDDEMITDETIFVPLGFFQQEKPDEKLYNQVKLLSLEVDRELEEIENKPKYLN